LLYFLHFRWKYLIEMLSFKWFHLLWKAFAATTDLFGHEKENTIYCGGVKILRRNPFPVLQPIAYSMYITAQLNQLKSVGRFLNPKWRIKEFSVSWHHLHRGYNHRRYTKYVFLDIQSSIFQCFFFNFTLQ